MRRDTEKEIEHIAHAARFLGLLNGKMGACVTWFILGKHEEDSEYTRKAQELLKNIFSAFSFNNCLDLQDGLTGMGLGLEFLIRRRYVEGDINKLLRHVDAHIYKVGCQAMEMSLQGKDLGAMVDILLYETVRHESIENPFRKECCRRFIIALMNHIYIKRAGSFYDEPLPYRLKNNVVQYLWTLLMLKKAGIEEQRIGRILSEMSYTMLSHVPILQPSRLLLFITASRIAQETGLSPWADYANLLKKTIDFGNILDKDIYDKNIFVMDGAAGIYLLADYCKRHLGLDVPLDTGKIRERIEKSSVWDRMEQDEEFIRQHYSLNGYCGIQLFLRYLEEGRL